MEAENFISPRQVKKMLGGLLRAALSRSKSFVENGVLRRRGGRGTRSVVFC